MENSRTILYENLGTKMLEQGIELPYIVPKGYFDNLASSIISQLPKDADSLKSNEISLPVFCVPNGYFDNLSNNILASISDSQSDIDDELAFEAPIFKSISRQLPYEVPNGYFENLQTNNVVPVQQSPAKVISITTKRIWLRMAVAASLVSVMVFSASIFYCKNEGEPYASYKNVDLNKSIIKLSDDDLIKYLDNEYIASNNETIILDDGAAPSLEQDAQAVPDDAMNQYLQNVMTEKRQKKGI